MGYGAVPRVAPAACVCLGAGGERMCVLAMVPCHSAQVSLCGPPGTGVGSVHEGFPDPVGPSLEQGVRLETPYVPSEVNDPVVHGHTSGT